MSRKVLYSAIAIMAVIVRLILNYHSELIPGINGGYYPVQVRTLLTQGQLGFSDMPLYFLINAFLVKVISFFTSVDTDILIIHTLKVIDSVSLPLLTIPLYLINRKIFETKIPFYQELALVCFATLSFSPLMLTSDLQKNAFAIPLMFFFLFFFLSYLKSKLNKCLILAIVFLILSGLTHFGVFAINVAFFLIGFVVFFRRKALIPVSLTIITGLLLLYLIDSSRILRLLNIWSVIFEKPALLQGPLQPTDILNCFLAYLLIGISIYNLIKLKESLSGYKGKLLIVFIICLLILSFPLVDIEYFRRFSLILFVPQTIVLIILFSVLHNKFRIFLAGFAAFIVFTFLVLVFGNTKLPAISIEAFNDMKKLENLIDEPDKTIIVARHGLEWWVAWELKTKVAQDKGVDETVFRKYNKVIVLEQKKGINQMHPGKSSPFHEPLPPKKNELIYTSEYFNAYEWINEN